MSYDYDDKFRHYAGAKPKRVHRAPMPEAVRRPRRSSTEVTQDLLDKSYTMEQIDRRRRLCREAQARYQAKRRAKDLRAASARVRRRYGSQGKGKERAKTKQEQIMKARDMGWSGQMPLRDWLATHPAAKVGAGK